jgi:hypothetical protein
VFLGVTRGIYSESVLPELLVQWYRRVGSGLRSCLAFNIRVDVGMFPGNHIGYRDYPPPEISHVWSVNAVGQSLIKRVLQNTNNSRGGGRRKDIRKEQLPVDIRRGLLQACGHPQTNQIRKCCQRAVKEVPNVDGTVMQPSCLNVPASWVRIVARPITA